MADTLDTYTHAFYMSSALVIAGACIPFLMLLMKEPGYESRTIKHLMTGPEGNSEFCSQRISMFPETKSSRTKQTKQTQNLKTALRFQPLRATAVNSE